MRYPEDSHEYLQDLSGHNQEVLRQRMEEANASDDAQIEAEAEMQREREAVNYRLIIFDVDGTLTTTRSEETFRSKWIDATFQEHSPESDWRWLPGRLERLKQLQEEGVKVAFATNQGGVAFGFLQWPALWDELVKMAEDVGIPQQRIYVCYTHPQGTIPDFTMVDNRRKPGSGMLEEAMEEAHVLPSRTLSVGDRPEDEEAARNAGSDFMWADDFFEGGAT